MSLLFIKLCIFWRPNILAICRCTCTPYTSNCKIVVGF
jgi:hypothetical protein